MSKEIFYSQVNENLQLELIERAKAGFTSRTSKSLDFMVGKIANVEIIAYKNQQHSIDDAENYLGILGGLQTTSNQYLPGRYLNPKFKYKRIAPPEISETDFKPTNSINNGESNYSEFTALPYITAVDIQLNDTTTGAGLTNTATVNIQIPNPIQDLDYVESVFMRPGRALTLTVAYPDSAVITNKELSDTILQFPTATPKTKAQSNLKMNQAIYDMLVISFSMSYEQNGTVTVTLNLRGTSGVYTDVTAITTGETGSAENKPLLAPIYQSIHDSIHTLYNPGSNKTKTEIGSKVTSDYTKKINDYNDKWWMVTTKFSTQYTYCTMGYLIDYINDNILRTKQESVAPGAAIVFNPNISKSKIIDDIISGYPQEVILDIKDVYGTETWVTEPLTQLDNFRFRNYVDDNVNDTTTYGYPSLIWINTKIIKDVEDSITADKRTVKYVINGICEKIKTYSGNMINLQLSPNPTNLNELLLFDMNNINLSGVIPFSIPMTNLSKYGSIVKDFQVEAKLPQSAQSLMYAINNSDVISEKETAPYINYMYNNFSVTRTIDATSLNITDEFGSKTAESERVKLETAYKQSYEKYKTELQTSIQAYVSSPVDDSKRSALLTALAKRVQYPTSEFKLSNALTVPRYPHEISFTIDGINGFRYGDAVEFNFLPTRYKYQTTFSIISITHTVSDSGVWSTQIRCMMRPDFSK